VSSKADRWPGLWQPVGHVCEGGQPSLLTLSCLSACLWHLAGCTKCWTACGLCRCWRRRRRRSRGGGGSGQRHGGHDYAPATEQRSAVHAPQGELSFTAAQRPTLGASICWPTGSLAGKQPWDPSLAYKQHAALQAKQSVQCQTKNGQSGFLLTGPFVNNAMYDGCPLVRASLLLCAPSVHVALGIKKLSLHLTHEANSCDRVPGPFTACSCTAGNPGQVPTLAGGGVIASRGSAAVPRSGVTWHCWGTGPQLLLGDSYKTLGDSERHRGDKSPQKLLCDSYKGGRLKLVWVEI